jgi:hypothetical protein
VSFLDRLKREADQQRAIAEVAERERDERDSRYKNEIEPRMKALTTYLEGLVATLIEVKPPISVNMPIQGYGDLAAQPIWDYKLEHERRHRAFVINLQWTMRVDPERAPVVRADSVTRVKTLTSLFRQHHLGGIKEEKRTLQGEISVATFHARGYIKATMQAQISAEDPILRLTFVNASWLGSSRRQVPWQQIEESWFDKLARFLVREDDSLFTEEVTDELRQKLRKEPEPAAPAPLPGAVLAQARMPEAPIPTPAPPVATAARPATPVSAPVERPVAATPAAAPTATPAPRPAASTPPPAVRPAEPAPVASAEARYVPGVIPAPPPPAAGEMIPIDESKLDASAFKSRMDLMLLRLRGDEGNKSSK